MIRGRQLVVGNEVEEFWALKDVNFEIKRGEVVGIIGRNGAGKSTLLKVLSRITEPTTGRVEIRGRVASLLEVGTGFHPELTGRENIFLNGAILGMTQAEIKRKFDEIVAFAEVEKFLDTPVKRYSSGMYVRLAFAVAAHLEPEILIVDEVLAVGDAEFQKKCLGKMKDVAGDGRTVLFVSHNMAAVQSLCTRCIRLQGGSVTSTGSPSETISLHLSDGSTGQLDDLRLSTLPRSGRGALKFFSISFRNGADVTVTSPKTGSFCRIVMELEGKRPRGRVRAGLVINDALGRPMIAFASETVSDEAVLVGPGDQLICKIDRLPLTEGRYGIAPFLEVDGVIEDWIQDGLFFDVGGGSFFGTTRNAPNGWNGRAVLVDHTWTFLPASGPEAEGASRD